MVQDDSWCRMTHTSTVGRSCPRASIMDGSNKIMMEQLNLSISLYAMGYQERSLRTNEVRTDRSSPRSLTNTKPLIPARGGNWKIMVL